MDPRTLQRFRSQIGDWLERRLADGRHPFRRVEICPRLFWESKPVIPDLVLWINRSSCLAGGIIMIPPGPDQTYRECGRRAARALGLSHFVLWHAREVSIWSVNGEPKQPLETLPLAGTPEPGAETYLAVLDQLLSRLKLLSVRGLLPPENLPPDYFANLCRLVLEEALPAQLETSRTAGDGMLPDQRAARAARDKVWSCLWRLLLLLTAERLPPSLQPHRLDLVMHYALAEVVEDPSTGLLVRSGEPDLSETASVGFYHLGNRLQQLTWARDRSRAAATVTLLLRHAAIEFGIRLLESPDLPPEGSLAANCDWLGEESGDRTLVAPAPYRAGRELLRRLRNEVPKVCQTDSVTELAAETKFSTARVQLSDPLRPDPSDRRRRLLKLREAWPNHRFQLPADAPLWVWEGLHLSGLLSASCTLQVWLPADWAKTPGAELLWDYLQQRHQLLGGRQTGDAQFLWTFGAAAESNQLRFVRDDGSAVLPLATDDLRDPLLLSFYLSCDAAVLSLVQTGRLRPCRNRDLGDPSDQRIEEIFLFLHSSLGLHLCREQLKRSHPPSLEQLPALLTRSSLLVPSKDVLGDFALLGWTPEDQLPQQSRLDRILRACWGTLPAFTAEAPIPAGNRLRRTGRRINRSEVAAMVFADGIPNFPEDYLRRYYRPQLREFLVPDSLEAFDAFFDKVFLRSRDGREIEIDNLMTAKALLLASRLGLPEIRLPTDVAICEQILTGYLEDLEQLWRTLLRECRRQIPGKTQAQSMARKIWREQKLPDLERLHAALRF